MSHQLLKRVADAVPLVGETNIDAGRAPGDAGALDRHVGKLGNGEKPERHRHERQMVPEIKRTAGPAQRPGLRIAADHRQHEAEACGREAFQRRLARQHADHREAEDAERQQLGRGEIEHDRPQHRDRHGQERRAEHAADERGGIARAERARRHALLRERMAVEHGRRSADRAGHAEQYCRDEVRHRRDRGHAEEQREGGVGVEVVGEGDEDRERDDAAQSRDDAKRQAEHDAARHDEEPHRLEHDMKRLQRRGEHAL